MDDDTGPTAPGVDRAAPTPSDRSAPKDATSGHERPDPGPPVPAVELENGGSDLVIVGVGASAGGLEALQILVSNLDASTRMAFVVAQHVSADYRSMLVDLLSRHSVIEVSSAEDGQRLRSGHVYVCPPGFHITIGGHDEVSLSPVDEALFTTKPSIDLLFNSIAEAKGPRSIGIILSGTGTDGTSGVGAIKDVDGFSIAQSPESAKYDGMPSSAIKSGKVDLILRPEEIGTELSEISPLADRPIPEFRTGENRDAYERILRLIKRDHGVDFGLYKDKTLSRRILRRMIATKTDTITRYAESLIEDADELNELFHDLLIGVTRLFRDPEAWDTMRDVLTQYIADKDDEFLRIWSVGCSTGEEPYTIAILLAEILGDRLHDHRIQIFATDVNGRAIERARRGRYSAAEVSNIPKEVRERYFVFAHGYFEVVKSIKQLIVFSQHDVVHDPPFLRQDLVVCRNVLIYFGGELQENLLPTFHYVLNQGGLLFLGQAESVGPDQSIWATVDAGAKIFRAASTAHRAVPRKIRGPAATWAPGETHLPKRESTRRHVERELDSIVTEQLERMLTPSVIVLDAADSIVYSHGDTNPVLQRQSGLATDAAFSNVHPDLVVDLRTALHRLRTGLESVSTDFRRIEVGSDVLWVRLHLSSATSNELGDLAVVYCQIETALTGAVGVSVDGDIDSADEHERLAARLREQLAIVMEELDNSNEEMQALNEELQSSNEELQSSNEELETTNEELQSTNEELQTAYSELRIAFDEKAAQETVLERTADQLTRTNELLVVAESVGGTGSWRWRPAAEELVWSDGLFQLLDIDPDTAPSFEALVERVHRADRTSVEAHLETLLRGDRSDPVTFRLAGSPTERWIRMASAVGLGQYRSVREVTGSLLDVTEEQDAAARDLRHDDRIADFEEQIQFALRGSANGSFLYDLSAQTTEFVSTSYTEILGWTKDDLASMGREQFLDLIHPDDRERFVEHLDDVAGLARGEGLAIRYRIRDKNDDWVSLEARNMVFDSDRSGRASKMLGTFTVGAATEESGA